MEKKISPRVPESLSPQVMTLELSALQQEIIDGLSGAAKSISSKFFYDKVGSELFGQITQLEEYYPSRTEMGILDQYGSELVEALIGKSVIELGSGDASKISKLIKHVPEEQLGDMIYYPVDVSASALAYTSKEIQLRFPRLQVKGIVADFIHHLEDIQVAGPKTICFFGSTLGNFTTHEAQKLLKSIRNLLQPGDHLLLGLDRVKSRDVLLSAYNDRKGITALFNLNILQHINSLIGTNFDTSAFSHEAIYNELQDRIEMYLIARKSFTLDSPLLSEPIHFEEGERIHTENSHKYSEQKINALMQEVGFEIQQIYSDEKSWFSLVDAKV